MDNALIDRFGIEETENPMPPNFDMKCECGGRILVTMDLKLKLSVGYNGMPFSNGCLKFTCLSCQEVRYIPIWERNEKDQMVMFGYGNVSY